ncbi:MAG: TonB-dependent receptor [Bacteroidota bacterium]
MMDTKRLLAGMILALTIAGTTFSQDITQVVRGKIVDEESQMPLPFTTIAILTLDPVMGTTSDDNGFFRLDKVPVGRHNIQVSFMGYEPKVIPELLITSGKEVVLEIGLIEQVEMMDEVVVKAYNQKDKPLNSMSTVSARSFSVEEAQRYAGGFDDPARLASSFAGVATGYLDDNAIIVRGNAPKGLLWRLEGIEIPNPNHFANLSTFGGGGVSALSSLMLANSDFFTGAFPAEYGNAMSGVFDIKLRTGNNEKHEHAVQIGALGLDLSSEGPFSKNGKASYLFNYRYSTFGLIKPILPEEANIPVYQDLCFKINLPTDKAGVFSLWALGADDKIKFEADADTSVWSYTHDQEVGYATQRMAAIGLNHRYILGSKTYLNSTLALSGDYTEFAVDYLDFDLTPNASHYINNLNKKYTLTSTLNHKFSAKHTNRTGFIVNNLHYNNLLQYAPSIGDKLVTTADENGSSNLIHLYSQSKFNLSSRFVFNLGMHGLYFDMNSEVVLEPRAGATYHLTNRQSISLAYGKHSRLEPQSLYFARVMEGNEVTYPNKGLSLSKAHHFVLAYDINLNSNIRLKVEPYFQYLYDIPVSPDSSYSTINMEADWFFTEKLVNRGTGTNLGIDLTLERFLKEGFYYLFTASLFESKYVGGDGIERDTRYNSNYVVNLLVGKEWSMGITENKFLGVNARLNMLGGQRVLPLDRASSLTQGDVVYDYSRPFEDQKPNIIHLNASITYRINKKKHASIWSLQVLNLLGAKENYGYAYNYRTDQLEEEQIAVVVPSLSYKIEF